MILQELFHREEVTEGEVEDLERFFVEINPSGPLGSAWRIIPFSKWLVTPIYKPFRPCGRGITPFKRLTYHGYQPLTKWDDPPSGAWKCLEVFFGSQGSAAKKNGVGWVRGLK